MTSTRHLVAALAPVIERVHRGHCWIKTPDGPRRINERLDDFKLAQHAAGRAAYGACPIAPGSSTTRLALLDFDSHKGEVEWEMMRQLVGVVLGECAARGLRGIPFRSSGGAGVHVYFLWDEPQDAYSVRELLREVLADCLLRPGAGGLAKSQVEVFPKQNSVPADGYGSMFVLPLAGQSVPLSAGLELWAREHVGLIEWPLSDPVPLREKPKVERTAIVPAALVELQRALTAIPNATDSSLDYDDWRNVVFALHHATDGSDEGLALAHEFSARSPKYDPEFLDNRVWPYVRSDRDNAVTVRTLYAKAREYGYTEPVIDDFEVLPEVPPTEENSNGRQVTESGGAHPERTRFQVLDEDALLAFPRPHWYVKGVLPVAELAVIYGASGSGKSFVAIDLFAAIARGVEWRGLKTRQASVVYVAAEGQGGFRNRLEAYRHQHQAKSGLRVIVDAPNLLKTDAEALAKQIIAAGGAQIIVIDTLAQVSPGGDENSAEDMGKVLLNCRKLRQMTGAMIVLIHHAGKDLTKGARGWSGLKAAADVEIEINRLDEARWARVSKNKDGEDGAEFPFRLLPVVIGVDEEGDDITSCVIEHVAATERTRQPTGANNRLVWRVANDLAGLSDGSVPVEVLVSEVAKQLPRGDSQKDKRRFVVRRAIEALMAEGFVRVADDVLYTENLQNYAS